jgi:protein FAM32A
MSSAPVASRKPMVVGGKLKLKGSSDTHSKKKNSNSSTVNKVVSLEDATSAPTSSSGSTGSSQDYLTESQKRHLRKKLEREQEEAKNLSTTSFRERIDQFNNKLASMTEHNDIPRISAAGNG